MWKATLIQITVSFASMIIAAPLTSYDDTLLVTPTNIFPNLTFVNATTSANNPFNPCSIGEISYVISGKFLQICLQPAWETPRMDEKNALWLIHWASTDAEMAIAERGLAAPLDYPHPFVKAVDNLVLSADRPEKPEIFTYYRLLFVLGAIRDQLVRLDYSEFLCRVFWVFSDDKRGPVTVPQLIGHVGIASLSRSSALASESR